ncbi:FmdB family zinc ribbon protein [Benzoatithermus flavus]|uniref:Zinc ribbon domain-containing protein n=1 Tax=Benzoatithermus flavus TaxID=3108223 RepID=A0ABU8XT86_9PROT
MPLYDYECADHGPFRAWARMAEALKACPCPLCGEPARRQISAPNLNVMNGTLRKALARAERSSDEPRVAPRKHLANCGCSLCAHKKAPPPAHHRWAIGH